jgi:Ca2+-binding RTX toxin-like protein
LDGGDGNDFLSGENGNDTLTGGAGSDIMNGGDSDDFFFNADGEADNLDGGDGTDTRQDDPLDTVANIELVSATPEPAALTVLGVNPDGSVDGVISGSNDGQGSQGDPSQWVGMVL